MSTRKIYLLGSVLFCAALLAACASTGPAVTKLVATDAGSTVHLKEGDTLEITLDGNPTTGYTWEVASDSAAVLVQQGQAEFKADSSALGSGGLVTLSFKVAQPGTSVVSLIYHRAFEPKVPPLRTFEVNIIVDQ